MFLILLLKILFHGHKCTSILLHLYFFNHLFPQIIIQQKEQERARERERERERERKRERPWQQRIASSFVFHELNIRLKLIHNVSPVVIFTMLVTSIRHFYHIPDTSCMHFCAPIAKSEGGHSEEEEEISRKGTLGIRLYSHIRRATCERAQITWINYVRITSGSARTAQETLKVG
jgi:hypothetical protein